MTARTSPLGNGGEISEEKFGRLMKDETFVDFLNVFLSLPSFSQRLMYMYDKKTFQFDPPLKRRHQMLEKQNLTKWLLSERLPYFAQSEFYLEYLLCDQLMTCHPKLSTSSHDIDYEAFRILEDKNFVKSCIGHVVGMCHFRNYLSDTPGEKVLEFWKDAERFHRTKFPGLKRILFREIQLKFFKQEGLMKLTDSNLWQALNDGAAAAEFNSDLKRNGKNAPVSFRDLQNSVMTLLQHYWLQKYLIHQKALREKRLPPPKDATRLRSMSDLRMLRDLEDIDKALAVAQGSANPNKKTQANAAKANWAAMFPRVEIDDSFLTSPEDIVTSHSDGDVTLTRAGSEFDVMLARYFESSSESESETEAEEELKWEVAPMAQLESDKKVDHVEATRRLVAEIAEAEQRRKNQPSNNLALFEQLQGQVQGHSPGNDLEAARPHTSGEVRAKEEVKLSGSIHADLKFPRVERRGGKETGGRPGQRRARRPHGSGITARLGAAATLPPLGGEPGGGPGGPGGPGGQPERTRVKPVGFTYTNLSAGNYRYDNKGLVRALASDAVSGRPFCVYLMRFRHEDAVRRVRLWAEIHAYLSLSLSTGVRDVNTITRLRLWRAHRMINRYLYEDDQNQLVTKTGSSPEFIRLPTGVAASIRKLIVVGKADPLLAHVQDYLCQSLHGLWKSYVYLDKDTFVESAIFNKPGGHVHRHRGVMHVPSVRVQRREKSLPPLAQGSPSRAQRQEAASLYRVKGQGKARTQTEPRDEGKENRKEKGEVESKGWRQEEDSMTVTQEDHKGLLERRMWRAVQLVAYITRTDLEPLLMDPLPLEELEYNGDDTSGSLAMKKLLIMRRRDLVEAEQRRREAIVAAYTHKMEVQKAKEVANMPPEMFDDSIPEWAKPFKGENKRWVFRPPRPRTFTEIFKTPYSIEFFKKYLQVHGGIGQLNFWCEVESLKRAKDLTYRQQKINQILRRYFLSPKGYASLECNNDVIKEIPKMEKVTPAMLVSGQSCISKIIEEKWFSAYQATFPELEPEDEEMSPDQKETRRQWTTDRSRALWISFVKTVMRFRHAIMDKEITKQFGVYLKNEIVKETDKQKAAGNVSYVPGLPIKKVIKNRLIDVTKLLNDLAFLAEAERYRALCDNASEAARQGIYRTGDQELLDMKAKTIIMCYLDSDIPPRIQVNASSDVADNIMSTYQSGLVDRGLFHDANMIIFPVMAYLWKKFQKIRFAQMLGVMKEGLPVAPLERAPSTNFLELSHEDGKKIISVHEDDPPRILFSLSNGLRFINPPTREQLLRRALEATRGQGVHPGDDPGAHPHSRSLTLASIGDPHLQGAALRSDVRDLHQIRESPGTSRHSLRNAGSQHASRQVSPRSSDDMVVPIRRRGAFCAANRRTSLMEP